MESEKHHDPECVTVTVPAVKHLIYYVQREVIHSFKQHSLTCFPFYENLQGVRGGGLCLTLCNLGTSVIIYMRL